MYLLHDSNMYPPKKKIQENVSSAPNESNSSDAGDGDDDEYDNYEGYADLFNETLNFEEENQNNEHFVTLYAAMNNVLFLYLFW